MLTEYILSNSDFAIQAVPVTGDYQVPTCTAPIPLTFTSGWISNPWCALDDPVWDAFKHSRNSIRLMKIEEFFQNQPTSPEVVRLHGGVPKAKRVVPKSHLLEWGMIARELFTGGDITAPLGNTRRFKIFASRNRSVHHLTFKGSVLSGYLPLLELPYPNHFYPNLQVNVPVPGGNISSFTPQSVTLSTSPYELKERLQDVKANYLNIIVSTSSRVNTEITELTWAMDTQGFVTSVDYSGYSYIRTNSSAIEFRVSFQYRIDIGWNNEHVQQYPQNMIYSGLLPSGWVSIRGTISSHFKSKIWQPVENPLLPNSWTPWTYAATGLTPPAATSFQMSRTNGGFVGIYDATRSSLGGFIAARTASLTDSNQRGDVWFLLNDYWRNISPLWIELIGLWANTGNLATENLVSGIEANNIENLTQIEGFIDFIEFGLDVVKLLALIETGALARAGLGLVDLLANGYLLYKYGLLPTLRDAIEFTTTFPKVIEAIRHLPLGVTFTGYGSVTYNIPDDGFTNLVGLVVTARTMVRSSWDDTTTVSYLLPAKMVGLLPTLAALWDLVPFGFIVDWFTNLSAKFGEIDSQLRAFMLKLTGSTSSLELWKDLDASFLEHYGSIPLNQPRVVAYERVVEPTLPSMAPSRYDFSPPPPLGGKWKIGVSLLWTYIRS